MLRMPTELMNKKVEEGSDISNDSSLDDSLSEFDKGSQNEDSTAGISDNSN
jgi:hypothetical protein